MPLTPLKSSDAWYVIEQRLREVAKKLDRQKISRFDAGELLLAIADDLHQLAYPITVISHD